MFDRQPPPGITRRQFRPVTNIQTYKPHVFNKLRLASRVGRRVPSYCTAVGKAILAGLPEAEAGGILRRSGMQRITAKTITTLAAMRAELAATRSRGYSVDDEENEEGVRCIAPPRARSFRRACGCHQRLGSDVSREQGKGSRAGGIRDAGGSRLIAGVGSARG